MTVDQKLSDMNLEELRRQLTNRIAIAVMCCAGVLAWYTLTEYPTPFRTTQALGAVFVLAWGARTLNTTNPTAGRHALAWGMTGALMLAMWLFAAPWVPLLSLIVVFTNSMLVSGGGIVTAGVISLLAVVLTNSGTRAYSLFEYLPALAAGVILASLVVNTFYTALEWAWTMQKRADQLLETARDRQGELGRALNSLDKTNWILRRTQRELIAARCEADEARLMKEQFAANISHELRTPLSLLLGFSELMHLEPEVYGDFVWPATLRRDVYQIYRNSRHLLSMINDVLDLSRFEIVGFTLEKEKLALEPILHDVAEMATDLFKGKPVHLEVQAAPDLPVLEIDRIRIRQVLLNLLNNAARFTDEGYVRIEATCTESEVLVSVSDTGMGIPADRHARIFEEFYQLDRSLHRKHNGAGLGLAICKHFVQAHEGRIWVQSQPGQGSTFCFTLPIPGRSVPVAHLTVDQLPARAPSATKPHILVVDPDPALVSMIDRHIETCDVTQVDDPMQVKNTVMLYHPQAVIYNTRPGRPLTSCEHLAMDDVNSLPPPIIECSLPSQSWLADDLAVRACLTKPFSTEQLLRQLDQLENVIDVLVVDDDRGLCELVERMLTGSGRDMSVRQAYDGESGLFAMRSQAPQLLLLDLMMPGIDGFELLQTMRQDPNLCDIPVVLLTATSYSEDTLTRNGGQMVIRRANGLRSAEVLRCLRAVVGELETHYDERSVPD